MIAPLMAMKETVKDAIKIVAPFGIILALSCLVVWFFQTFIPQGVTIFRWFAFFIVLVVVFVMIYCVGEWVYEKYHYHLRCIKNDWEKRRLKQG